MNKTIYVVMGTSGEYSDRDVWSVCAYEDEGLATKHADEAMRRAAAYKRSLSARYSYDLDGIRLALGPWDPEARTDYGGTDYYVLKVPVREELP